MANRRRRSLRARRVCPRCGFKRANIYRHLVREHNVSLDNQSKPNIGEIAVFVSRKLARKRLKKQRGW